MIKGVRSREFMPAISASTNAVGQKFGEDPCSLVEQGKV